MAVKINNLTDEMKQRHIILFEESEIVLILKFNPSAQIWTIDVTYKDISIYGYKLSLSVSHFESKNLPFDFVVEDATGEGIDPFKKDDFSQGRCLLYMLETDDMEIVRDAPVPI